MVRERGYLARWLSKSEQVALFFGGVAQNLRTNGSILSYYSMYCLELDEDYTISEENSINYGYPVSPDGIGNIDESLILPTGQGIMEFEITTDDIEWTGYFDGDSGYINHHLIDDKYFAMSSAPDNYQGLKMYDMTDPACPEFVTTYLNDHNYRSFDSDGDYFIMRDYNEYLWDIYKYEDNEMQLLLSNTASGINEIKFKPFTDGNDPNSLYAFNNSTHILKKYDVAEQNVELTYEATYQDQTLGFVKNGLGYFMTDANGTYDMLIYDGFDVDDPVLVSQYTGVATDSNYIRYINDDYLAVLNGWDETIIYSYQDAELTGQSFQLTPSTVPSSVSSGMLIDNYLVGFGRNKLFFYEISDSTSGYVQPVLYIPLCHRIYRVILNETSTGNYLICFSQYASSIVSVDVSNEIPECEIVKTDNSISNYPNPFNPETTISFALSDDLVNVSLKVYNIKGQLVKKLLDCCLEGGTHNIIWQGNTEDGKQAATGVYFYQLKAGDIVETRKMMLIK